MNHPMEASGTIEKFMSDFNETRQEAIRRWEAIMRTHYPDTWKVFIRDDIREMNMDEEILNGK